jgi:hypothetical protein
LQVTKLQKTLTLNEVTYSVGLAWGKITPTTITNCWKMCPREDDNMADETNLIPFPKQDMKAVYE